MSRIHWMGSTGLVALAMAALSTSAMAQTDSPATATATVMAADAGTDSGTQQVVVVATRSPQNIDKVGNSVTVLDEQAIQSSQQTSLADLLAETPGVVFSRSGGPGTATSINIRGSGSDQVVTLIDGVPLSDPSAIGSNADLGNLLIGDISRIEVLRGSQSTLYGSAAMGGVIDIITAEPDTHLDGSVNAEFGSRQTGQAGGAIGDTIGNLSFRLAGNYYGTQSVPAFDQRFGGIQTDPFHDGSFSGRANYAFTPDVQLDLRSYYIDSVVNYDGYPPPDYVLGNQDNYTDTRELVNYSGLNFNLFDGRLKNRVAYQYTTVNDTDYLGTGTVPVETGLYDGTTNHYEYQGTLAIAPGYQAVFGLQQENSFMDSDAAPLHAQTGQNSVYAQLQGEVVKDLTLTAGERRDHYDTFGAHYTGQGAAAYALPSDTVLRASWAQGYKAPSLYQLYSPYGNQALSPELSTGWDAGVEQHFLHRTLLLSATYFSTNYSNLIEFDYCPGSPLCLLPSHSSDGYYANTNKAKTDGVELQAVYNVTGELSLSGNYSHINAIDETPGSPTEGQQAYRQPKDVGNAQISYTWPVRLNTIVAARFAGYSTDENFNVYPSPNVTLGGYTLVDLRASYPLKDDLELYGRVENLFNKWYETVYQYGTWGRAAFVGLRAKL